MVAKKGEDDYVWIKYPQHHNWFNKLWLSEKLGYKCGPAGVDIPEDGLYVIRPIYNLSGMGVGAYVQKMQKGDHTTVQPGYFWQEHFYGPHYSTNYKWVWDRDKIHGKWKPISCWEGINFPINWTKFTEWKRVSVFPKLPSEFDELYDVGIINVESIETRDPKGNTYSNVIEVHLRPSPDPEYDHLVPVWKSTYPDFIKHYEIQGYKFVEAYEDADKHLEDPRLGFLVK